MDNVITFDENGEGVSVTKLSPAAVKANTVNTKCPANDTFTGGLRHDCCVRQKPQDGYTRALLCSAHAVRPSERVIVVP